MIGVQLFIDIIPAGESRVIANGAFLTASSILFGFATTALTHFSNKKVELRQKASDIGKEFCDLYKEIVDDKKLSSKIISFKTMVPSYGGMNFGTFGSGTGKAPAVISEAYDFLVRTFRWWINMYWRIIYIIHALSLAALGISIVFSLLAFAPNLVDNVLSIAGTALMSSIPLIGFGWYLSNRWYTAFDESLFNIRQQIFSGLQKMLPQEYQTYDQITRRLE